jgi:hypothetical protein
MGVESIDDVIEYAGAPKLRGLLSDCRNAHIKLGDEIEAQLDRFHDEGKDPNPIAQGMSVMKTNMKLIINESDHTIADLMTDGCNMGVKSLSKYLNEYKAASEASKDVAKRLISLEEKLAKDIRGYL